MKILKAISKSSIQSPELTNGDIVRTCGGRIGHVIDNERFPFGSIAIQLKYWPNDDHTRTTKITSPVYTFDSDTARYAGWQLLRRGITDGMKEKLFYRKRKGRKGDTEV